MYQTEKNDQHDFAILLDGHAVANVTRLGRRIEGDDAAGWATSRGLPVENHLTDEQWQRLANIVAAGPALLDSIDQVAAALETLMSQYGDSMSDGDRASRYAALGAARRAQANAEGFKTWEEAVNAWCE